MQKRKSCEGCPAFYDPCLWSGSGDNPAHLIVVAENPSGFSIGASKAFSGYNGRMFRRLLNMTRGAAPANGQLKIYYTYAVLAGQIDPTAEHLRRCQANLQRELQLVTGADGREPLILTLGVNALKALGISVKKLTDAIGRPISYVVQSPKGPRQLRVVPMFAMGALDKNPGWTQVAIAGLHQATTLALAGVATESHAEKIGKLTENYVYPKTIEEVRALISHIIGYYDRSGRVGPDGWMVALDTETNCLEPSSRSDPKVLMLSVAWDIGKAATILLDHPETPYPAADAWAEVRRLLESPKPKVFHNLKFDQKFIERVYGIRVHNVVWDTMCGEHFLDEDKKGMYGLKKLVTFYAPAYTGYDDDLQKILRGRDSAVASFSMKDILQSNGTPPAGMDAYLWGKLYQAVFGWDVEMKLPKEQRSQELLSNRRTEIDQLFKQLDIKKKRPKKKSKKGEEADTGGAKGFENVPLDTILSYAGIDADATRIIARTQLHRLGTTDTRDDGMGVMHGLYVPASRALGRMEHNGFRVDREYLDQVEDGVTNMLVAAERELRGKFDSAVNYSSPAQVVKLMSRMNFENIKGAVLGVTDKATLDAYIRHYQPADPRHEFASRLLEFRAAHKAKTGFLRKIRKLSAADGMIHCAFNLTGTATGRLCVSGETLLETSRGTFSIAELDLTKHQNVSIMTHKGRMRRILRKYFKGFERMVRVCLDDGSSIVCTRGHRLLTPHGWRHVSETAVGGKICGVHSSEARYPRAEVRAVRERLCADTPGRRSDRTGGAHEVRSHTPHVAHLDCRVPQEIQKGTTRGTEEKLRTVQVWKQIRRARTIEEAGENGARKSAAPRVFSRIRSRRAANDTVVCAAEHAALRLSADGQASKKDARDGLCVHGETRNPRSRYNEERAARAVLRKSAGVFRRTVPCVRAVARSPMVHPRAVEGTLVLRGERTHSEKPHLLVRQPCRATVVDGAFGGGCTACSRVHVLQKLPRGFLVSCDPATCRSRRGIPLRGPSDGKTRHPTRHTSAATALSGTAVFNQRSTFGYAFCCRAHPERTIVAIEDAGVKAVWDIEVADDHSYVAQGMIHHNSSSRPNMQNIPKYMCRIMRTDSAGKRQTIHPGFNIKKLFIPSSDEYRILNIDIKGAELRVYTAYSHDQNMIDALLRGLDVHSYVTSKITGIPYDVIEREKETNPEIKALRTRSKRVVFGIFYGAGAFKIAEQLGCTKEEAQVVIDQIFAEFPALHGYVEDTKNEVRRKQFVRTHFGRYRRFKLASVNDKHFSAACREAVNFLIQSTASDLVLGQLCEISDNVQDIQGRMLITVHDSIAMEIPADVVSLETVGDDDKKRLVDRKGQVHAFLDKWIVQRVRDKFPWLPVPYLYDIEVGPSYGETKPIERSG